MEQTRAVTKAGKHVTLLRSERDRAYAETTRKGQTSNAMQSKENVQERTRHASLLTSPRCLHGCHVLLLAGAREVLAG